MDRLERLNSLSPAEAYRDLLKCCGSSKWAKQMTELRPFESFEELRTSAERIWWLLGPQDWLEAFRSHPKIGEKKVEIQPTTVAQRWSEEEQSGMGNAAQDTMQALADGNRKYEETFGHIFIVCATGKSSGEMLSILTARLKNDREKELRSAAGEQAKITALRLEKLLNQ